MAKHFKIKRDEESSVIDEQKSLWLKPLLGKLAPDLDLNDKNIVELLLKKEVEIIEYLSLRALKVLMEGELVGEFVPFVKFSKEQGQIISNVTIESWSKFD